MRIKRLITTVGLLSVTGTTMAHGLHREVDDTSLLHLLEHAWPVIPFAILGFLLLRRWLRR